MGRSGDGTQCRARALEQAATDVTKKKLLLSKIESAKTGLSDAEGDLEKVLREIRIAPRAQKTTISAVVEDAFAKLRAARATLGDLEEIVVKDED